MPTNSKKSTTTTPSPLPVPLLDIHALTRRPHTLFSDQLRRPPHLLTLFLKHRLGKAAEVSSLSRAIFSFVAGRIFRLYRITEI